MRDLGMEHTHDVGAFVAQVVGVLCAADSLIVGVYTDYFFPTYIFLPPFLTY